MRQISCSFFFWIKFASLAFLKKCEEPIHSFFAGEIGTPRKQPGMVILKLCRTKYPCFYEFYFPDITLLDRFFRQMCLKNN